MNRKNKIVHEIKTKAHQEFATLSISCTHEYYDNPICPDLTLELAESSKKLLKQHQLYFTTIDNVLYLGQKDTNVITSGLPTVFPLIIVKIKVNNPRFWLVTDKTSLPKEGQSLIFKNKKNQFFENTTKSYTSKIAELYQQLRQVKRKEGNPRTVLSQENILGISISAIEAFPSLELETVLTLNNDLLIELNGAYYFFSDTPDLLGIALIDLNKIAKKTARLTIPFTARSLKLRYSVKQYAIKSKKNEIKIEDILEVGNELVEQSKQAQSLKFDIHKKEDGFIIESRNLWKLQEVNPRPTPNFFNMKAENAGGRKNFEVFLPFPKSINPYQIKADCLEQIIQKLRYQKEK